MLYFWPWDRITYELFLLLLCNSNVFIIMSASLDNLTNEKVTLTNQQACYACDMTDSTLVILSCILVSYVSSLSHSLTTVTGLLTSKVKQLYLYGTSLI